MPQAGTLSPPAENPPSTLRQVSTAPNLRFTINRYANLDTDSPAISASPPNQNSLPVKFFPLPSKYGQLTGSFSLSSSPKKESFMDHTDHFADSRRPSFTVGHDDDNNNSFSFPKMQVPSLHIQGCDTPVATPKGTPIGSPHITRRQSPSESMETRTGSGFFSWLTRPASQPKQEESTFFHQKEDMSNLQGLTSKARLLAKPRTKMPVSMSDVNVFTPTEY